MSECRGRAESSRGQVPLAWIAEPKGDLMSRSAFTLVAQLRDSTAVVGWAPQPEQEPEDLLTFASGCVCGAAYADRHRPGIVVVYASRGWTAEAPRQTLTVRTGRPGSLP